MPARTAVSKLTTSQIGSARRCLGCLPRKGIVAKMTSVMSHPRQNAAAHVVERKCFPVQCEQLTMHGHTNSKCGNEVRKASCESAHSIADDSLEGVNVIV